VKGDKGKEKLRPAYQKLVGITGRIVAQAKRFSSEIGSGVKRAPEVRKQAGLQGLKQEIDSMVETVGKVVRQAKARVLGGDTHVDGKILSVFETHTEIIRKGKASKPNEFGKMVKVQEAENQIVIDFEVYDKRPSDSDLLIPGIEVHQQRTGRTPDLTAADAGFFSGKNESKALEMGVKRVSVPSHSTKSAKRKEHQKQRWFKKGQKWRTGCEGRISVLKRRHGLGRSRYKGADGMKRWVGLGVIADNLINIGTAMAK
jgi:IS5 family transposase